MCSCLVEKVEFCECCQSHIAREYECHDGPQRLVGGVVQEVAHQEHAGEEQRDGEAQPTEDIDIRNGEELRQQQNQAIDELEFDVPPSECCTDANGQQCDQ